MQHKTQRLRQALCPIRLSLTLLLLPTAMPPAAAETRLEHRIAQAPSPHQSLGPGGTRVPMHWARNFEQLGNDDLNAQRLDEMRNDVRDCVQSHRQAGFPVKPVEEWPSLLYRNRSDNYVGPEAFITYSHASTYMLNPSDCSLFESEGRNASLRWSGGLCVIDLDEKTTSGNCPKSARSLSQPATGQHSAQGLPKRPPGMPPNPLLPRLTGEVRNVANQICDVATNPLDPDGGTLCYARAEGFAGHGSAPAPKGTPLSIESRSKRGFTYEADIVQMNFTVSQEIFLPHLSGGFTAKPLQGDGR